MGHSTLSFFFLTLPPMTRMKARWSMQSLKRRVWTIVWVFRIATFCKDLINGRIFVRGSIWMLLFLALCFIHIQDRSLFTQTQRLFHWCPQVWMCGGRLQYGQSWWIRVILKWKTFLMSSLTRCATNMKYLNAQKNRHEHQDEERAIDHTLHDDAWWSSCGWWWW